MLEQARELGAELLATGHYVRRTVDADGLCHLRTAANRAKDQSYFLYSLSQQQLRQVLFPLGEIASKDEVRSLAAGFGLAVANKGDSQEVCFIPTMTMLPFWNSRGLRPIQGISCISAGQVLGRHFGTHRYTHRPTQGSGDRLARTALCAGD